MGVAGCADFRETRQGFGMVENSIGEMNFSSVLSLRKISGSSEYENAAIVRVLSAQCSCCVAIRSCATLIVEKLAAQSCNCSPAVGRLIIEEEKQSTQCSKDEPCLSDQPTRTTTNLHTLEEYSPDSCSVHGDDRFLQGPDRNVIMSSKEVNEWISVSKNKDDDEDDDDEDDDDDDDDDEADNDDDDVEDGSGEEEEGGEELEGGEGDEDEEGGEEDDDEGDEGEEGEDGEEVEEAVGDEEEDEDGVEGEEEEDGAGDEDEGYDEEEGEEDEDEEDEDEEDKDEEDKDETSEPPKKKRK